MVNSVAAIAFQVSEFDLLRMFLAGIVSGVAKNWYYFTNMRMRDMVRNIFMPTILSMAIFVLVQGDFKIFKVTTTDLSAIAYMVFAGIFGDVIVDKVSWAFKEGLVGYLKSVLNTHGTNAGGTGSPTYKPPANTPPDIPVVKDSEIK